MSRTCLMHISGNQYSPFPVRHHTRDIWTELAKGFDEYHVLARSTDMRFSHTVEGNIHLHLLPSFGRRMWVFLFLSWLLPYFILRYKPTHLLAQCPVIGGLAAAFCARISAIPLFVELHGNHYFMPPRKGLMGRVEYLFYRILSVPAFNVASRVRSLSTEMTDYFIEAYGSKYKDKLVTIPVRVDLSVFPPKQEYARGHALKLATVGRLCANKNQLQLLSHLAGVDFDVELTIVGSGDIETQLRDAAAALPSNIRVIFTGQLNHQDLCAVLARQDVYVHYALAEGTPRAIIEAMAIGLPVIATSAGFMKGILVDKENAFILNSPDAIQLGRYLQLLNGSESLRIKLGKCAQATVQERFEWNHVFSRYRDAILSMKAS